MFDFADETENEILSWKIQFIFCAFCPLAIVIQERYREGRFNKHEWNNFFLRRDEKFDPLIFYFDVIQRRLSVVLMVG